jgi:hypothetical protein
MLLAVPPEPSICPVRTVRSRPTANHFDIGIHGDVDIRRPGATRDHRVVETSAPSLVGRGPQRACSWSACCAALDPYRDLVRVIVLRYHTTRWL